VSAKPYREAYTEAALEEVLEIEAHLEAQRSGLGGKFRSELNAVVNLLLEFPEAAPAVTPKGVRRRLLHRFPYAVLYVLTFVCAHWRPATNFGSCPYQPSA
jgi:plasmid stabilization system protein ParE